MKSRPPVSACLILRDAAETVSRAIDSVRTLAREIVVVLDDATTDATEDVLARYGARVERKPWTGFADARNRSFELAREPWLLVIDGDEQLVQHGNHRAKLAEALASPDVDGIAWGVQSVIGGEVRRGARGDQIRVCRNTDRIRWKFAIHNQLRGYRPHSILKSTALLHAHYPLSYDSRWERNEGRLLQYRHAFTPETEEWRHATAYLCRGASCVGDHAQTIRYAMDLCKESPELAHPSVWAAWVAALVRLDAPAERIDEVIEAALSAQPKNADVLWWRMQRTFGSAAMRWATAVQDAENYAVDCWSAQYVDGLPEAGKALGMSFVRKN